VARTERAEAGEKGESKVGVACGCL
jgi:hypothetical protein